MAFSLTIEQTPEAAAQSATLLQAAQDIVGLAPQVAPVVLREEVADLAALRREVAEVLGSTWPGPVQLGDLRRHMAGIHNAMKGSLGASTVKAIRAALGVADKPEVGTHEAALAFVTERDAYAERLKDWKEWAAWRVSWPNDITSDARSMDDDGLRIAVAARVEKGHADAQRLATIAEAITTVEAEHRAPAPLLPWVMQTTNRLNGEFIDGIRVETLAGQWRVMWHGVTIGQSASRNAAEGMAFAALATFPADMIRCDKVAETTTTMPTAMPVTAQPFKVGDRVRRVACSYDHNVPVGWEGVVAEVDPDEDLEFNIRVSGKPIHDDDNGVWWFPAHALTKID